MINRIIERLGMTSIMLPNSKEHYEHTQDGKYVEEVVLLEDAIQIVKEESENEENKTNEVSKELKPCPFCGSKDINVMADIKCNGIGIWCECNRCFSKSATFITETDDTTKIMSNIERAKEIKKKMQQNKS